MSVTPAQTFVGLSFEVPVVRLALAAALGLFLGLEREWSEKEAGIRTFSLTALLGAVFSIVAGEPSFSDLLVVVGGVLVITVGVLLASEGLYSDDSLALTTTVSLMVAYGVGVLVALGFILEGVTVAVVSSALLVLKRELHGFADALSRKEIRSTTEFAILAFVVFPLLPPDQVDVFGIPFEPRIAWLMVVTVAGLGILNYALVHTYGGRGLAVTGFFGGLASSAAVVGTVLDHVRNDPQGVDYGVAGVLLANAAMALRNLGITLAFTVGAGGLLLAAIPPLGSIVVTSLLVAASVAQWDAEVSLELENPFSLRNALAFGSVFAFIIVGSALLQAEFGAVGLFVGAFVSGLVSSAGVTTSAVLLYRGGTIEADAATVAILLATAASIVVKTGLAIAGPWSFFRGVAVWSGVTLLAGFAGVVAVVAL